ncbi:MAG: twin-arginine translocation signal domain-containing protein, partial [Lacipirellulaceae bacterium]
MADPLSSSTSLEDSAAKSGAKQAGVDRTAESVAAKPSRRKFLKRAAGSVLAAGVGTLLYTWRFEPHWV